MKNFARFLAILGVVLGLNLASVSAVSAKSLDGAGILQASSPLVSVGITMKEGTPDPTDDCNKATLFGMPAWYKGLAIKDSNGKCVVGTPKNDEEASMVIWIIILNVTSAILVMVGYLALGFVIYGGYLYILAGGDTGKVAKGKKTLTAAIIGLVIILLANGIINTILRILGV